MSDTTEHAQSSRLVKNLKPHWVWAIALGSAVGWGAFILPADWMGTAGPLGALLGLAIGGGLMIIVGVSYGFLARVFPVSGGAFAYTLVGFGRTHAFICAWFMTLGYVSIVALNASALALLGKHVLPQVAEQVHLYNIAGWDVFLGEVLIAMAALVVVAVINIRGGGNSSRLQFWLCVIMIAAVLFMFIGVLFVSPTGDLTNMQPLFAPDTAPVAGVLAIVAIAPWAFIGFDNIPQTAEEFDFPAKKAFPLIFWSLVAATIIYLAMITTTASGQPWQELLGDQPVWATADVVTASLGITGLIVLCLGAGTGIVTGLNGFYIASSRVLLAMGRAHMIPPAFRQIHPTFKTPHTGVIFVMIVCLIAPWFGRNALSWIVDMASIGFTFAFLYTCACAYKMFQWTRDKDREHVEGSASTPLKLLAAAGILVAIAFTILLLAPGSPAQLTMPSFIAMGAWLAIGAIFYTTQYRHNQTIPNTDVDTAVLGKPRPHWAQTH